MSLFLTFVPHGAQLYHGTQLYHSTHQREQREPVIDMDWLAFEPEHALPFARPRRGRPRRPPGGGDGDGDGASARLQRQWR